MPLYIPNLGLSSRCCDGVGAIIISFGEKTPIPLSGIKTISVISVCSVVNSFLYGVVCVVVGTEVGSGSRYGWPEGRYITSTLGDSLVMYW